MIKDGVSLIVNGIVTHPVRAAILATLITILYVVTKLANYLMDWS